MLSAEIASAKRTICRGVSFPRFLSIVLFCRLLHVSERIVITYRIRRMGGGNSFTLFVCLHGWGIPSRSQWGAGRGTPIGQVQTGGVWYPPPSQLGQYKEYSLHGGRYASCVHAGGLSCLRQSFVT